MTRLEANKTILKVISEYIEAYPDMRFHQALQSLGITQFPKTHPLTSHEEFAPSSPKDQFYEESSITCMNITFPQDKE